MHTISLFNYSLRYIHPAVLKERQGQKFHISALVVACKTLAALSPAFLSDVLQSKLLFSLYPKTFFSSLTTEARRDVLHSPTFFFFPKGRIAKKSSTLRSVFKAHFKNSPQLSFSPAGTESSSKSCKIHFGNKYPPTPNNMRVPERWRMTPAGLRQRVRSEFWRWKINCGRITGIRQSRKEGRGVTTPQTIDWLRPLLAFLQRQVLAGR